MAEDGGHRVLLALRHVKSSWDDPGLADHDRPLAPRGRRALQRLEGELARRSYPIDLVLCSSAVRATATLEGIRAALPDGVSVVVEDRLYTATVPTLLHRLHAVPASVGGVLVIGHNPGLEQLVGHLAGRGDPDALAQLATKFPTGALATLRVPGRWSALVPGACELERLVVPRRLG